MSKYNVSSKLRCTNIKDSGSLFGNIIEEFLVGIVKGKLIKNIEGLKVGFAQW